jgi:hypothetical protein
MSCQQTSHLQKVIISLCDLTTYTWQDLPNFQGAGVIRRPPISMAGLAQCTFEIKFDAVLKKVSFFPISFAEQFSRKEKKPLNV